MTRLLVFDSGIGGLSVAIEIRRAIPAAEIIYVADDADQYTVQDGILADVAPTLLDMLGLAQPAQMTGHSLLAKK